MSSIKRFHNLDSPSEVRMNPNRHASSHDNSLTVSSKINCHEGVRKRIQRALIQGKYWKRGFREDIRVRNQRTVRRARGVAEQSREVSCNVRAGLTVSGASVSAIEGGFVQFQQDGMQMKASSVRLLRDGLIALMLCLFPAVSTMACPPNAIGSTTPSTVYGYVVSSENCAYRTLEEAETEVHQAGGSYPEVMLAFPIVGSLDVPGLQDGTLDYRTNGANSDSSGILRTAAVATQSTFTAFVKDWPPAQLPAACQNQPCTSGSCTSMADEAARVQCAFDATWAMHPEYCWQRQGNVQWTDAFNRVSASTGNGTSSGTVTFGPSSSTSFDSGGLITISAASCSGASAKAGGSSGTATSSSKGLTKKGVSASTTIDYSWGATKQSNTGCPGGSLLNINVGDQSLASGCAFSFIKLGIKPPTTQNTSGQCPVGDPCYPGSGNEEAIEHGFKYGAMTFDLYYNSLRQTRPYSYVDHNWSHTYATRVLTEWASDGHIHSPDSYSIETVPRMVVQDNEGHVETYLQADPANYPDVYRSTNTLGRILRWNPATGNSPPFWELFFPSGVIDVFDRAGRLIEIVHPDDPRATLQLSYWQTFDSNSGESAEHNHLNEPFWRLKQVVDGTGRSITFHYTPEPYYWLTDIVADDGTTTLMTFGYDNADGVHRLTQTTQFGKTRTYLYNEPGDIGVTTAGVVGYWLTGILDEDNHRYATYQYDEWGRVTASWHGSADAGKVTVSYPDIGGNPVDGEAHVTLPSGVQQTYSYPASEPYRHAGSISDGSGTSSYTYDDNQHGDLNSQTHRMLQKKDANGNITKYEYDSTYTHRTAVVEAFGMPEQRRIETDWDWSDQTGGTNRVVAQRVYSAPNDSVPTLETSTTYIYDPISGALKTRTETDPATQRTRTWTYSYCQQADVDQGTCPLVGLLRQVDGPRTNVSDLTTYAYYLTDDLSGCGNLDGPCHHAGDLHTVTNARDQITTYVTYDLAGRLTRERDANGTYTDMSYDPRGWLTSSTIRANGDGTPNLNLDATTVIDHDDRGDVTKVTQPADPSEVGTYLAYQYDNANRLIKITDNLGDAIDFCPDGVGNPGCLDAEGNHLVERIKDPNGTLKRSLSRQYDEFDRLTALVNGKGVVQQFQNPPSPEGPPSGVTYTHGYDGNGNPIYSVDSNGVATEQQYDPLNRLKKLLQDHTGKSAQTQDTTTQYGYDARDNLVSVTDPNGLPTNYIYDGLNNLTDLHSPDTGHTGYTYDDAGNLFTKTDARGVTSTYTFDALNRLTGISYPDSSLNVTYTYDQPDTTTGCSNSYPIGRLTTMSDSSGTTEYCYDRRGNLTSKVETTAVDTYITDNSYTYTTGYSYTLADRLRSITYPSGDVVSYARDSVGRVQSVTYTPSGGAPVTVVSNVSYYPFGPINSIEFGNGRTLTKTYDQDYAIDKVVSSDPNGLVIDATVDVLGNLVDASSTVGVNPPTRTYAYDPLYRLTDVTNASGNPIEGYTYNATGDRLTKTINGATDVYTYSTPLQNHRLKSVNSATRNYDDNGNTTGHGDQRYSYTYDATNRLASAVYKDCIGKYYCGTIGNYYLYNGRGERAFDAALNFELPDFNTTTESVYDERGQLLAQMVLSSRFDNTIKEYLYLDGTPVATISDGQLYYIETDQLGTPRDVVQPSYDKKKSDVVVWKWDYFGDSFGANNPDEDPDGNGSTFAFDLRFPGQVVDERTGLNYNYFRDYEPGTGRYVESDPIGLYGDMNRYAYVDGSPLNWNDALGLSKGGKKLLSTEGFTKRSKAEDVAKALADAIKKGQTKRAAALRALLKVIKRGGTMMFIMDPSDLFRYLCAQGELQACRTYCMLEPDDADCRKAAEKNRGKYWASCESASSNR